MAKLPTKNIFASETADFFRGIDRTDSIGKLSDAYDMANIRILPDGSMVRRDGYSTFMGFPSTIRCVAACPTDPDFVFVLSGETLYSVKLSTNTRIELSTGFNTYAPAFFFRIHNLVYLFCEGFYGLVPDEIISKNGYVPLVGKNWGADGGPVYEQQNMLAFNIRIDYLLDRDTNCLFTGYDISAVDAVYVNGEAVKGSYIERQNVCLPAVFPAGTRILLCLSLSLSQIYDVLSLMACSAGYSCGYKNDSVAILYGGEEPGRLFFLSHIDPEKVAQSQVYYSDSGDIYCPATPTHIKDMIGGVRAICGEPDCLIVAGQYETRRLTPDGDMPILGMEGCSSPSSMAYFDEIAYIATPEGIWRLPLRSGKGKIISTPLGDLMEQDNLSKVILYYNVHQDELWVRDPSSHSHAVYIYDPVREIWTSFFNIPALGFFDLKADRAPGFWSEIQLMKFEDGQDYDVPPGGQRFSIPTYYMSRWTCLGKPDEPKRLRRVKLARTGQSQVIVSVTDKAGDVCVHTFAKGNSSKPIFSDEAIRSGRTDMFQAVLISSDQAPLQIHEFSLSAIK